MKDNLNLIVLKIKNIASRLRNFLPSALPQGVAAFEEYADSIIETYSPPMSRRDVRFVLATLIMRLDPTDAYKPKRYFALALHKGAASQVAVHVMEDIKREQNDARAAELQAAKQLEATAQGEASNVQSIQS